MENRKIRVAITHGDTNGIGYELIFKTFADPTILELCTPIIYGSPKVAAYHRNVLGIQANFTIINKAEDAHDGKVNLLTTFDDEIKVDMGEQSDEAGTAALKALKRAVDDHAKGLFDVLVTAPVNPSSIKNNAFPFTSQTDYLERTAGNGQKALTILVNEHLRVAMATRPLPVKDIAGSITKETVVEKARVLFNTLKRDFIITNPRIAILALNPFNTKEAPAGKEEQEIIIPAIADLEAKGIQAFGPYPADGFFGAGSYLHFDGILAMYHDQGLAPFKTIALENGVNYTAGLPIVRTSPDHGTAYDIAGQDKADENSMRQAIYTAIDVFRNRKNYNAPLQNPLPKLFHEKREDGDKARFTRPKDQFKSDSPRRSERSSEVVAEKKTEAES